MAKKKKRGGKRKNAGRKMQYDTKKRTTSVALSEEVIAYIDSRGMSRGNVIEPLVRRSKDFRDWQRSQADVVFKICPKCNLPCGGRCGK